MVFLQGIKLGGEKLHKVLFNAKLSSFEPVIFLIKHLLHVTGVKNMLFLRWIKLREQKSRLIVLCAIMLTIARIWHILLYQIAETIEQKWLRTSEATEVLITFMVFISCMVLINKKTFNYGHTKLKKNIFGLNIK